MNIVIALVIVISIVVNAIATTLVVRSHSATHIQKTMQLILVWVVPIIGAVLVGFFHIDSMRTVGAGYKGVSTSITDNDAINLEISRSQEAHHVEH